MPRYLSEVISYYKDELGTCLLRNPTYDEMRRISSAYVNFTGYDANHYYTYEDDEITLSVISKNGNIRTREYHMEADIITSCTESYNNTSNKSYYEYRYDYNNYLTKIVITDSLREITYNIEWEDGNIACIKEHNENYHAYIEFEYERKSCYKRALPMFHIAAIAPGSVVCVDEILTAQGYFGKSISKDLPIKEYHSGYLSREFKYTLDKYGYISQIQQTYKGETIRKYCFMWGL